MIESVYDRVGVSSGWNVRESGAKRVSRGHALRAKVSLRFEIGRRKLPQDSDAAEQNLCGVTAVVTAAPNPPGLYHASSYPLLLPPCIDRRRFTTAAP